MKILISSGGTKVPIDDVRSITNNSTGNFGKRLAVSALLHGHNVTQLHAEGGPHPFNFMVDLTKPLDYQSRLEELHCFSRTHFSRFKSVVHKNYEDYIIKVEDLVRIGGFDAFVSCAAVSDFNTLKERGKISSNRANLPINTFKTLKTLSFIKDWNPKIKLVGFKYDSDVMPMTLITQAERQLRECRCDFVVANDQKDLEKDVKKLYIVDKDGWRVHEETSKFLADIVIQRLEQCNMSS